MRKITSHQKYRGEFANVQHTVSLESPLTYEAYEEMNHQFIGEIDYVIRIEYLYNVQYNVQCTVYIYVIQYTPIFCFFNIGTL